MYKREKIKTIGSLVGWPACMRWKINILCIIANWCLAFIWLIGLFFGIFCYLRHSVGDVIEIPVFFLRFLRLLQNDIIFMGWFSYRAGWRASLWRRICRKFTSIFRVFNRQIWLAIWTGPSVCVAIISCLHNICRHFFFLIIPSDPTIESINQSSVVL